MFRGAFSKPVAPPFGGGAVVAPPVSNWWEAGGATGCIAAYQGKGVASYAASKVNLANPGTYNLTEKNGAVSWSTSTGWDFVTGNAQALATGVVQGAHWSALIQFTDLTTTGILFGLDGGTSRFYIYSTGSGVQYANEGFANVAPQPSAGNLAITDYGYRDGVLDSTSLGGNAIGNTRDIFIGAWNDGASGGLFVTAKIRAVAIYNNTLDATKVAAVRAAMAAL